jgi:hypothetical protein
MARTRTSRGKMPTDVKAMARVHTETMLNVLKGIATNVDCPPAARVAAAMAIINRGWGQPHQSIDLTAEITTSKVIRTPTIANDTASWLKQHGDKTETLQ